MPFVVLGLMYLNLDRRGSQAEAVGCEGVAG